MWAVSVSLLAILGSSAARPNVKNGPSILPHGMIPSTLSGYSERIHNAVLGDSTEEEQPCKDRLAHIRSLMAAGKLKEAVDVSLALEAHHRASKKHADCHADQPHVGEGSITTRAATSDDRGQYSSGPVIDSFIKLHHRDEKEEGGEAVKNFLRIAHTSRASVRKSMARVPVVGFALDNTFVLTEAPLRCTTAPGSSSTFSCSGGGDLHEHPVSDEKEAAALLLRLSTELTAAGKRRRRGNEKKESESRRLMAEWTDMGKPLVADASVVAAYIAARESNNADTGRIRSNQKLTFIGHK